MTFLYPCQNDNYNELTIFLKIDPPSTPQISAEFYANFVENYRYLTGNPRAENLVRRKWQKKRRPGMLPSPLCGIFQYIEWLLLDGISYLTPLHSIM